MKKLSQLEVGDVFEIYEDMISRHNAFPKVIKFSQYESKAFEVVKMNRKTVRVQVGDEIIDLKFSGTKHWRSKSKDADVCMVC